jgi:hypothetical protein
MLFTFTMEPGLYVRGAGTFWVSVRGAAIFGVTAAVLAGAGALGALSAA